MSSVAACWRCARYLRMFNLSQRAWGHCRAPKQMVALAVRLFNSKYPSEPGNEFTIVSEWDSAAHYTVHTAHRVPNECNTVTPTLWCINPHCNSENVLSDESRPEGVSLAGDIQAPLKHNTDMSPTATLEGGSQEPGVTMQQKYGELIYMYLHIYT